MRARFARLQEERAAVLAGLERLRVAREQAVQYALAMQRLLLTQVWPLAPQMPRAHLGCRSRVGP